MNSPRRPRRATARQRSVLLSLGCFMLTRSIALVTLCLGGCGLDENDGTPGGEHARELPVGLAIPEYFPLPLIPPENESSEEKIELGRWLFYDRRLSGNGEQRCADCHQQRLAFTDGRALAIGSTGEVHPRSSMGLTNIAYAPTLGWADAQLEFLEEQALIPMFGEFPIELGLASPGAELLDRLRAEPRYQSLFPRAFSGDPDPFTVENVTRALAAFQRSLISSDSPFDRYFYGGDEGAISEEAKEGFALFSSEKFECFHCHGGFNFSDAVYAGSGFRELSFHNTGLYMLDPRGSYPEGGQGLYEQTRDPSDMGRFKAPTLRNVEVTAPYMHDGSVGSLDEVLDFYAAGGRFIEGGALQGDGRANPLKSIFVVGFTMSPEERAALLAFLRSLTDEGFLNNPAFSDPADASGEERE